jgi:sRNA-binding regulator protein Hfq
MFIYIIKKRIKYSIVIPHLKLKKQLCMLYMVILQQKVKKQLIWKYTIYILIPHKKKIKKQSVWM